MIIGTISYNEFVIEYKIFGKGKQSLLAFHGTGREAEDYVRFEDSLGEKYTIISINLFFHGNSQYPKKRLYDNQFKKKELKGIIEQLLDKLKIDRFSIIGYSLGGRIGLCVIEALSNRIDKAILIASDGLQRSVYNDFTTHTRIGKNWVKWHINNPDVFFKFMNKMHKYKLLSGQQKKVMEIHFENDEKRRHLRDVISCYKYINPNINRVTNLINNNEIEIVMIFGKFDFIVPQKRGRTFLKKITSKKELHIIKSSHNILTDNATKAIAELIV